MRLRSRDGENVEGVGIDLMGAGDPGGIFTWVGLGWGSTRKMSAVVTADN
jgi:hypothetical protein